MKRSIKFKFIYLLLLPIIIYLFLNNVKVEFTVEKILSVLAELT